MKGLLEVRRLGLQPYESVWHAMQHFTDTRNHDTPDQIWLLQHYPVFTQGQAGKPEHLLNAGDIPVVQVDRGGQITYHGPGQIVAYLMLDVRRLGVSVRQLVQAIEQSLVDLLHNYGITAHAREDAPGVYVEDAKIASLGLRIRKGCSFHGLALNADMDLQPFLRINPCGYKGLRMTQLAEYTDEINLQELEQELLNQLVQKLDYKAYRECTDKLEIK